MKLARKEARRSKYKYIEDMIKKLGLNGIGAVKNKLGNVKNPFEKLYKNTKDIIE